MKIKLLIGLFAICGIANAQTQSISAGCYHSIFLCNSGIPMGCGANFTPGELGNGTPELDSIPINISSLTGIIAVSAGGFVGSDFSLFLKNDGTVWGCGYNYRGQLGNGTTVNDTIPTLASSLSGITAISAGSQHSLFLKNDSTVWAAGAYQTLFDSIPVQVVGLSGIISISAGVTSLFLKKDGTVWESNFSNPIPVQIASLNNITAISAGDSYLFLKNDSTVWASGNNVWGQLGDGTTINRNSPVQAVGLTGITAISQGAAHSLFLKANGTVYACGSNASGEFGNGTTASDSIPVPSLINGVIAISGGKGGSQTDGISLFKKNDGTVWGCGYNGYGQLGDGTLFDKHSPSEVNGLCPITTAINEIKKDNTLAIYPNPFNRETTLTMKDQIKDATLIVCNLYGQIIKQLKNISGTSVILNRDNLSNGIYFVSVLENNKILSTNKLIITD
jgi:alpha-tubulin suppressor-like RCC1 family protein